MDDNNTLKPNETTPSDAVSLKKTLEEVLTVRARLDEFRDELYKESARRELQDDRIQERVEYSIHITVKVIRQSVITTLLLLALIVMSFFDEQLVSYLSTLSNNINTEVVSLIFGGLGVSIGAWQLYIARKALRDAK